MIRIGLTGGIAAGKSVATRRFAERGATVVDHDLLAREAVAPGSAGLRRVVETFGEDVVTADGSLDRPALARIVFADEAARERLNGIVHPEVRRLSAERERAAAQGGDAVVVHDIPLLVETAQADRFDLVVVVHTPAEERLRRLAEGRGMTAEDARARIGAQASDEDRLAAADVILDGSGSEEGLRRQVDDLYDLLGAWRAEEVDQPVGWDLSRVASRMHEPGEPWDLEAVYREVLDGARSVLDMGTGGGEFLLRFRDHLPADTVATEGWEPNVEVARAALGRHGIDVVPFGQPEDLADRAEMPFPDDRFDVVLNRHETYHPAEVARVLRPGGTFVTQQVGGGEFAELRALTGTPASVPQIEYADFRAALDGAGLEVLDGADAVGSYEFPTVADLVAYASAVPWQAPADFTVATYLRTLVRLHRDGPALGHPVRMTRRRFWLRARKVTAPG
ncbi:dephospho-CoA kinase [Georgenia alba]|uniref:Dephospho-CoA kinase n=1 Tax=Georgenia alba TaxID=2233858 RepID=A0ABW2QBD2_9MICO